MGRAIVLHQQRNNLLCFVRGDEVPGAEHDFGFAQRGSAGRLDTLHTHSG